VNDLPKRRRRGVHTGHGHARPRAGFSDSPQGRQVLRGGGIAAAAAVGARPPAILALHDPWTFEDVPTPVPVFGQYPRGLIDRALPLLNALRREVLHVCSGSLPVGEGIRVDVRPAARPDLLADGRQLPIRSGTMAAVMLDPPYTEEYARGLYGVDYPRPSHLLAEAARVVRPGGRIAFVHFLVPYPPEGCRFVRVVGISTGCGYALRALTVFEREQDRLL
jgi:hypothetical protein